MAFNKYEIENFDGFLKENDCFIGEYKGIDAVFKVSDNYRDKFDVYIISTRTEVPTASIDVDLTKCKRYIGNYLSGADAACEVACSKHKYMNQAKSFKDAERAARRLLSSHNAQINELKADQFEEMKKIRAELEIKFAAELKERIEFERAKFQLELDKAAHREENLQSTLQELQKQLDIFNTNQDNKKDENNE